MSYTTKATIELAMDNKVLIHLTQDDKYVEDAVLSIIDEAIAKADAEIELYLSRRYTVPLVTVPKLIENISTILSIYYIYSFRMDNKLPEEVTNKRIWALDILNKLQLGVLSLRSLTSNPASRVVFVTNREDGDITYTKEKLTQI